MNKKDIADSVSRKADIKRFEAYCFVDVLIDEMTDCLGKGDKIVISNLGTWKVAHRKKKKVLNPNDRKVMIIPERKIVKFIPSNKLKDSVDSLKN